MEDGKKGCRVMQGIWGLKFWVGKIVAENKRYLMVGGYCNGFGVSSFGNLDAKKYE